MEAALPAGRGAALQRKRLIGLVFTETPQELVPEVIPYRQLHSLIKAGWGILGEQLASCQGPWWCHSRFCNHFPELREFDFCVSAGRAHPDLSRVPTSDRGPTYREHIIQSPPPASVSSSQPSTENREYPVTSFFFLPGTKVTRGNSQSQQHHLSPHK